MTTSKKFGIISAIIASMSIDLYAAYVLASTNPWYGLLYFAVGYPLVAGEKFAPNGWNTWCGSPENPQLHPLNYYYLTESLFKSSHKSCPLNEIKKRQILFAIIEECNLKSPPEKSSFLQNFSDENFQVKLLKETESTISCLYIFYLHGGEQALIKITELQKNGD